MISYTINFTSDSKTPFVIPPGQYDGPNHLLESPPQPTKAHTSLNLPGAGTLRYGEMVNEDLVHLLEHFYATTPPLIPTYGQTWTSTNDHLSLYASNGVWTRMPVVNPAGDKVMDGDIRVVDNRAYLYAGGTYIDVAGGGGGGDCVDPCAITSQEDWGFLTEAAPDVIVDWGLTGVPADDSVDWGGICIGLKEDWGYTDEVLDSSVDWGTVTDNNILPDFSISWGSTVWTQTGCFSG